MITFMDWLNYHHLYYFWSVAHHGSMVRAAESLSLTQPTISAQIRELERAMGGELFHRQGKQLKLTEFGRTVLEYADRIFSIGDELIAEIRRAPLDRPVRLTVGVSEAMPQLIVRELLKPLFEDSGQEVNLVCHRGPHDRLLLELIAHRLDLILTDQPASENAGASIHSHLLGESGVVLAAPSNLAGQMRIVFPKALNGVAMMMPVEHTPLRRTINRWLRENDITPRVVGEFADSTLLKTIAMGRPFVYPMHEVVKEEALRVYGVEPIGRIDNAIERFYAISGEQDIRHPVVKRITERARHALFGDGFDGQVTAEVAV